MGDMPGVSSDPERTAPAPETVPRVSPDVHSGSHDGDAAAPVPEMRGPATGKAGKSSISTLARAPGTQAVDLLTLPLVEENEGARILILGDSRKGKSTMARMLVEEIRRRGLVDFVFAHDDVKRAQQFDGIPFANVAAMDEAIASGALTQQMATAHTLVFRGERVGTPCEVEEVAAKALAAGRKGARVIMAVDELDRCMTDGGKTLTSPATRAIYTQGGADRVTIVSLTQDPHRAPNQARDQATGYVFFCLGPGATNFLKERLRWLDSEMAAIMAAESPAILDKGDFIVKVRGMAWDRTVYNFGHKAAA